MISRARRILSSAVVIASPKQFHEEHAISAARAGKDVFLEKPIATSLAGADRVIAAARDARVRLQVGFQFGPLLRRHVCHSFFHLCSLGGGHSGALSAFGFHG